MIALIQRVKKGKVLIDSKIHSEIGAGQIILLGIFNQDSEKDIEKLVEKVANLRIMSDDKGKMNLSILDTQGEILVVSQFTLAADLTFGRRPSFLDAKEPKEAEKLYELFVEKLKGKGLKVETGKFGEYMEVEILNDGPVTIIVDTKKQVPTAGFEPAT